MVVQSDEATEPYRARRRRRNRGRAAGLEAGQPRAVGAADRGAAGRGRRCHCPPRLLALTRPRGTPVLSGRSLLRLGAAARAVRRADRGGEQSAEAAARRAAGEGPAVRGGRRRRVVAGGCGCVRVFSAYRRVAVPRVLLKSTLSNQKKRGN